MYKTTWAIKDLDANTETELVYYHFGKDPKFPTWYMEEGHSYEIEMIWNLKLLHTVPAFFKCLTHSYTIK